MSSNRAGGPAVSSPRPCGCGCFTRQPRYPSDLTDAQWEVIAPLLPVPLWQTPLGGRPEKHHRRAVIDAMFYVVDNGVKWRALPADFPPWQSVYGMHARWKQDGVVADITDLLRARARTAAGRDREPSAAIIDSQSVRESAEGVVPTATSGYDGSKKVNGRKRHILTDTLGLLITVAATPANVPDRLGAAILLQRARRRGRHRLALAWGDRGYEGEDWTSWAQRELGITIEVIHQHPGGGDGTFTVLPRRWVIERTHAWISRRRRCARDYERLPTHHEAMVHWAAIIQMTRRLATQSPAS
jgi:transposase